MPHNILASGYMNIARGSFGMLFASFPLGLGVSCWVGSASCLPRWAVAEAYPGIAVLALGILAPGYILRRCLEICFFAYAQFILVINELPLFI